MRAFDGRYIKCSGNGTVAVIFGWQAAGHEKTDFVQVITKDKSHYITGFGQNEFRKGGIVLDIDNPYLKAKGEVEFGEFTPIKYNAMGPFRFLPFMECRHTVVSMRHKISGTLTINGQVYDFDDGVGYIEGDRGRSFPVKYFWTQCNTFGDDLSIFASCGVIPYLGMKFNGTICIIHYHGKEYRLATYLGAKVVHFDPHQLIIRQGRGLKQKLLEISVPDIRCASQPLRAPKRGKMDRTIYECVETTVRYKFSIGDELLFNLTNDRAAYEFSSV